MGVPKYCRMPKNHLLFQHALAQKQVGKTIAIMHARLAGLHAQASFFANFFRFENFDY